ncbi:MAG: methionyl-tRNA formyltransferase [Candidatus Caldatribacteriaceae bacterium]
MVSKVKIVFMGTSPFAVFVLEEILKSKDFTVQAVVTKPACRAGRGQKLTPSPMCIKAQEKDLPVLEPSRVNDPDFVETLRKLSPEVIVVAAYGQILKRDILSLSPLGCVNVHASVLPRYRGPNPIRWALLEGETESGVSVMLMDEGVDTGPILGQRKMVIEETDNYSSLLLKMGILGGGMVREILPLWKNGEIVPYPQGGEVSYAPVMAKEMARISWEEEARNIVNRIRAFAFQPGAYTFFREKRIKILEASLLEEEGNTFSPGTIINVKKGVVVQTGYGKFLVRTVQMENRKPISSWDLCCGYQLKIGEKFQ